MRDLCTKPWCKETNLRTRRKNRTSVKMFVATKSTQKSNFLLNVEHNPRVCWFFYSVIGLENSRHSLYQSDATLKQITNLSPAFSRALGSLFIFHFELSLALKSIFLSSSSHCDCFGFGFTTLNWKALLANWLNEKSKKTLLTFAKGENGWLKLELILVYLPLQSN